MRVRQGLANHGGENQAGIRGRPGWDLGLRTALSSSRLPLERCDSARAGGGALSVIMSIIRSSRNPRLQCRN